MAVTDSVATVGSGDMGAVIRALAALRGHTAKDVAAHLHLSPGQLSKRLSGTVPFRARELQAVAAFLGVKPGLFYLPVNEVVERLSASGYKMTPLTVVNGPAVEQMELAFTERPVLASA